MSHVSPLSFTVQGTTCPIRAGVDRFRPAHPVHVLESDACDWCKLYDAGIVCASAQQLLRLSMKTFVARKLSLRSANSGW